MKVLLINDQFDIYSSGGHWITLNLAKGLYNLGLNVFLGTPFIKFSFDELRKIDASKLKPKLIKNNYLYHLINGIFPLKYGFSKENYSFIYIQLPMPITKGLCDILFKFRKIPTIIDFGDLWGFKNQKSYSSIIHDSFLKIILNNSSFITVASNDLKNYIKNSTHKNIFILNNSVDCINEFNPDLYPKENELYKKYRDKLIITYSGTVSKSKNVDLIVELARNLSRDILKNIIFLIIGDGPYLNEMKSSVKKLGLQESFHFTGFLYREQIPYYLRISNLGIVSLTKIKGGLIKLAEYMAMGVTPIVPAESWPSEHIKHGSNGIVVDKFEDILKYIEIFYLKQEMLTKISQEARNYALLNFDIRVVSKELLQL